MQKIKLDRNGLARSKAEKRNEEDRENRKEKKGDWCEFNDSLLLFSLYISSLNISVVALYF